MVQYTIYDVATGEIQRSGDHPDLDFLRENIAEGLAVHEGEALDDVCWRIENGVPVPFTPPVDLAALEKELLAEIDRQAEEVRGHFITNTASQPVVYLAKEAEATALMSDPDLSPALTPNLTLEAERVGESRFDVAVVILSQAHNWRQVSAVIENIRLGAKEAVRAAATAEAKQTAAEISWGAALAFGER